MKNTKTIYFSQKLNYYRKEKRANGEYNMNKKLKKFLHTFFKIFIIFLIGTAVINIVIFAVVFINHKNKLAKEKGYLIPPGEMVEVNDHDMHVWVTGDTGAEETLVFLHSSKRADEAIALQPLFKELGDYRIVFVERSGYGFSEESGMSRDIDTILEETRAALDKAGVDGTYTLVAMGTSGVEAFHWVNTYEEEVDRIIGLDMNYPEQFKNTTTEEYCGFFDCIMIAFYKIGGQRLVSELYPENTYGIYSDTQMTIRKNLISANGYNKDMYNEDLATVDNALMVAEEGVPKDIPINLIYANPFMEPYVNEDTSVNEKYTELEESNPDVDYVAEYNQWVRDYFSDCKNVTIDEISGPARVYTYNPSGLADMITEYLE